MLSRVGETRQSFSGQMMTIIAYRTYDDLDVQFESGKIAHHCTYQHFQQGNISEDKDSLPKRNSPKSHIGEIRTARNGLKMKLLKWYSCNKIEIEFEDGYKRNCSYTHFSNGKVAHPNVMTKNSICKFNDRTGETKQMLCGLKGIIVAYRSYHDIDVQFEDGTVAEHKDYRRFAEGTMKPPYLNRVTAKNYRAGEIKTLNSGRQAKIIEYSDSRNVKVKIIDTGEVRTKLYAHFKEGRDARKVFPYMIDTVLVEKLAYIHKNEGNFYCTCSKCGLSDVMSLKEIKEHICIDKLKK